MSIIRLFRSPKLKTLDKSSQVCLYVQFISEMVGCKILRKKILILVSSCTWEQCAFFQDNFPCNLGACFIRGSLTERCLYGIIMNTLAVSGVLKFGIHNI